MTHTDIFRNCILTKKSRKFFFRYSFFLVDAKSIYLVFTNYILCTNMSTGVSKINKKNEKKNNGFTGIRTHSVLDSKSKALTDYATAHHFTMIDFSSYLKCLKLRFRGFPGLISILNERGRFSSHNEPLKTYHTAPHFCQMRKTHRLLWAFRLLRKHEKCSVFSTFTERLKCLLQVLLQ